MLAMFASTISQPVWAGPARGLFFFGLHFVFPMGPIFVSCQYVVIHLGVRMWFPT